MVNARIQCQGSWVRVHGEGRGSGSNGVRGPGGLGSGVWGSGSRGLGPEVRVQGFKSQGSGSRSYKMFVCPLPPYFGQKSPPWAPWGSFYITGVRVSLSGCRVPGPACQGPTPGHGFRVWGPGSWVLKASKQQSALAQNTDFCGPGHKHCISQQCTV